jgi:predicted dehydrogenase
VVDFLNAIDSGSQISPNFRDGLKVMEVLEAGMRAAETGSVVKVGQSGGAA